MALLKIAGPRSKVGRHVRQFNLPAVSTCPGSTEQCRRYCYATKKFFLRPLVKEVYAWAYTISQSPLFVSMMTEELHALPAGSLVRLHSSGDFYDSDYVAKWVWLCRAHPQLTFWAYTRSWVLPEMESTLRALSELPNVELFGSADTETGHAPQWLRSAFVVPSFELLPSTVAVCPYQKNRRNTCDRCTYCFKPAGQRKRHVAFLPH